ncbi:hypothetical protein ARMSODRAFT_1023163 [Armillaria solidipes]|uniref:Uncharacterized protein n=1 Tax=Armillaria solidipes TaxID=1076256 RepID=A0A2H3B6V4_9AGAR|nr:hypothetical protein ARMSODRAFT_1023163 [Armillaria solidipes]
MEPDHPPRGACSNCPGRCPAFVIGEVHAETATRLCRACGCYYTTHYPFMRVGEYPRSYSPTGCRGLAVQENNPLYCQCGGPCDFHRVDEPVISSPADILAGTIPAFSSPPPPPVPVSAPIATPVTTAPSFFHPPPAGTGFQSISAPAPLPYPLVPSSSGSSAPHTPLQTNPASMVAQMVASSSSTASSSMSGLQIPPDPLLTTGLQPPPSFPAYTGPSGPLVNVNGRNGTNARRQQSY